VQNRARSDSQKRTKFAPNDRHLFASALDAHSDPLRRRIGSRGVLCAQVRRRRSLLPSPALGERCHRCLARRLIAVGRMVAPTARGNGSALHGRDGTRAAQQQEEPSRSCRDAEPHAATPGRHLIDQPVRYVGLARHFLQAQRVSSFGHAIFRREAARDASFRQPVGFPNQARQAWLHEIKHDGFP
jgi:hypothetical protein